MMHEWVHCCDEAASHQLPIAVAFWIIWIDSMEEYSSLTQNLMQIHCSTCTVILNTTATQYTCSLNGIYRPHWLVQWSHHCSCTCIPVHCPWLPAYIDVTRTILIILTMAWPFLDRPQSYYNIIDLFSILYFTSQGYFVTTNLYFLIPSLFHLVPQTPTL